MECCSYITDSGSMEFPGASGWTSSIPEISLKKALGFEILIIIILEHGAQIPSSGSATEH